MKNHGLKVFLVSRKKIPDRVRARKKKGQKGRKKERKKKKEIKEKVVHRAATKGLKKKDGLANEQKKKHRA